MEIREFAQAVLFAPGLQDKLLDPGRLTDRAPGPALSEIPERPGRSAALRLSDGRGMPFPKRFEEASARGLALHFFANHELLAMELMALMLLRFVEAPPAFREDLARTITEEQAHLRLYRDRMQALGVGLGDAPVNGFFWRVMKDAPTPLDFVVQMAMTFEQANLDYCVHYGRLFEGAEDTESTELLKRVYEDEVGHVMHGVRWFNAWRPEGQSAWQAYLEHLPDALTPARAKGPILDIKGRKMAGLDDDFIRHLRVFSASKGRRPRLFVFEPSMEEAWNGPKKPASTAVAALTRDLAALVGLLGAKDDRVVLERPPRLEFLEQLDAAGIHYPESQSWDEVWQRANREDMAADLPSALHPWGFTPELAKAAKRLCGQSVDMQGIRRWSSKFEARALLQDYLRSPERPDGAHGAEEQLLGALVRSEAELVVACAEAPGPVVVKAPFSASGRHRLRLRPGAGLSAPELGFIRRMLKRHGTLWVAPWLTRLRDLSVTLSVGAQGHVRLDPPLWLINDAQGAYQGHALAPFTQGLSDGIRRQLNERHNLLAQLKHAGAFVGEALARSGYVGPAGVDMMVFEDSDGQARLHPLLEINPRYTMGHIAQVFRQRLAPRSQGLVRHLGLKEVQAAGHASFVAWSAEIRAQAPVVSAARGIESGVVFGTDPAVAERVVAVLSVASSLEQARSQLAL